MVDAMDTFGRQFQMPKSYWRDNHLLPDIAEDWNQADKLHGHIALAIHHELYADVIDAARHLVEIDLDAERSHIALGIVLANCNRIDEAETIFLSGIRLTGRSGPLLTKLATIYSQRNEQDRVEATLQQAVSADPNLLDTLSWRLNILFNREGNEACLKLLRELATQPGAWRPQLWLARNHLQNDELDHAKNIYQKVIAAGYIHDDALMTISGDLGQKGHFTELLDLILPVYEPSAENTSTGLNLLQAHLDLRQRQVGLALLDKLYRLDIIALKPRLDEYERAFNDLPFEQPDTSKAQSEEPQFENFVLTNPVWTYSLKAPTWLVPEKPEKAPTIVFCPLAVTNKVDLAGSANYGSAGRYSRAVALYLSESLHLWTDFKGHIMNIVVKGAGPILYNDEINITEESFQYLPGTVLYFVTGEIRLEEECFSLKLHLWERGKEGYIHEYYNQTASSTVEALVLKAEQDLLSQLGAQKQTPFYDFYTRPPSNALPAYLLGLDQSLLLTLAANQIITKEDFHGERGMLELPLDMILEWPEIGQLGLLYVANLAKARLYGSDIVSEFERRSRGLTEGDEIARQLIARLSPLMDRIFSQPVKSDPPASEEYAQWIERIKTEPS